MRDATAVDAAVVEAARAALLETTSEDTVGELRGLGEPSDGVIDVHFANTMPGYPGWTWSVSVSTADGVEHPSVLELGLLPGEDSLVAPEWVPWSDRLAEYRAAQEAKDAEGLDASDDESEDELVEEEDLLGDEEDELDGVDFEEAAAGGAGDDDEDDADLEDEDEDDTDLDDLDDEDDDELDDDEDDDLEDDFDDEGDDLGDEGDLRQAGEGPDQDDTEEDGVR
ncbi:DUF3027 domain-containing protein [Naasia sp. SYSU D00057]|uniref:DUF3027 domain-containing protein n=1 Tax=Naasia sp. SYSU D00057 TaxID=2817380 RepID=UPI001B3008CE|nr:DUF3027 domain-containing protein [Naasia sp. SYSU D00057]